MDSEKTNSNTKTLLNQKTSRKKNITNQENINSNKIPKNNYNSNKTHFRIIEPYRSLGLYTDNNKIHYFKRATERFMLTSNEHSFILYNLEKLKIERISPPLDKKITALYPYKNKIFTGIGNKVQLWEKIHIIKEYKGNDEENNIIKQIMTFENVLLFITIKGDLFIYEINSGELINKLELNIDYFMHPISYINKILFTIQIERYEKELKNYEKDLILYDINDEKEITNYKQYFSNINSHITLIEQSPIIDIIGLCFENGDIILFNIKNNKTKIKLHSEYKITSLTFSTCENMKHSLLVTSCNNGIINIWDLNKKTIHYSISNDFSYVSNVMFLPEEPLMIATSNIDNSIKMYKFNNNTSIPQIFKFRNGHKSEPLHIRFYGESANDECNQILSCDKFNLRNISLLSEEISKEFSSKKFKNFSQKHEIKNFSFNEFRERDWSNIALIFSEYEKPILYSYENSCISEIQPKLKTKNSFCTCVYISICGNFAFCGFENGNIEKFNMQSGISRWVLENAHGIGNLITDIKSDGLNSMLISISKNEKKIKFWEVLDHSLIKEFFLNSFPFQLEINMDNDLVCVSMENNNIFIYDKSQLTLVRKFDILKNVKNNNEYQISDFGISRNANWLICATSGDKSLRIFDVISTNLIEWVMFEKIPLSISLSPNCLYLAMSFKDEKGVFLYINRTMFVDLEDVEMINEPVHCSLTTFKAKTLKQRDDYVNKDYLIDDEDVNNPQKLKEEIEDYYIDIPEENKKLITLSNENNIKYKLLSEIELLQERNAPKVKEKTKSQAPFFLFNINDIIEGNLQKKETKEKNEEESPEYLNLLKNYSYFNNEKKINEKRFYKGIKENNKNDSKDQYILSKLLIAFKDNKIKSYEITKFLNQLSPYVSDLEIRSLDPLFTINGENYLSLFSEYLLNEFNSSNDNYEMLQSYLNRFINIYSSDIMGDEDIKKNLVKINEINKGKYENLESGYNEIMCLVSHFGNIQI